MAMTSGSFLPSFRRMLRCERGDPTIEFIFILPLMLILGFGVMEVARILWYQHFITKGVRDGTRYLSRVPLAVGACGALPAAAVTTATGLALNGAYWGTPDPDTIAVTLTPVNHGGAFYGPDPLCMVRMTAQVPVAFPILDAFLDTGPLVTFTISNEARHIGQ
jgi:Flp pilus assembly protein TadG